MDFISEKHSAFNVWRLQRWVGGSRGKHQKKLLERMNMNEYETTTYLNHPSFYIPAVEL